MGAFGYVAPTSLDEVLTVLSEHANLGKRAQVLAGGTDMLVQMRSIDREPRTIVDIKKLAETNRISITDDEIFIGSAVPSAMLNENDEPVKGEQGELAPEDPAQEAVPVPPEDAMKDVEIVLAAYESAETNEPVLLDR